MDASSEHSTSPPIRRRKGLCHEDSHDHRCPDRTGCGRAVSVGLRPVPDPWQRSSFRRRRSGLVASVTQRSFGEARRRCTGLARAEVGTFGTVLVGANGNTLYAFTKDVDGVSTCFDACAAAWPAVTVTDGFAPPAGVDPALVTSVDRPDGTKQLKIGKWPLYFYAGDGAPGETNGQGVGGVWFVEGADGALIKGDAAPSTGRGTGSCRQPRRPHRNPPLSRRSTPAAPAVALPRSATWVR